MAASRKLQGEIDRCLKKVTEGVETFEETWQKVHNATNSNQKEKYEADLKKEIKKLQRLRDQIKSWIASAEIKDKSALLETRKLIETQMERFKVVERETKTKAYSKEGLGAAQKLDPAQKERDEMTEWLSASIDTLNMQVDQFECEIESLVAAKKKKLDKDKQDRVDELRSKLEKHRYHIRKLETLLRMLHNMSVDVAKLREIKDDVEYYVDSWEEPDFKENEFIYDDIIGLEEVELSQTLAGSVDSNDTGGGPTPTSTVSDESSEHPMGGASSSSSAPMGIPPSTSAPPISANSPSSAPADHHHHFQHKVVKPTAVRAVASTSAPQQQPVTQTNSSAASIGRPVGSSTPTKNTPMSSSGPSPSTAPTAFAHNSAATSSSTHQQPPFGSSTPFKSGENVAEQQQQRSESPLISTSNSIASNSRTGSPSLHPSQQQHLHHPHAHLQQQPQPLQLVNGPSSTTTVTTNTTKMIAAAPAAEGMTSLKHIAQEAVNKAATSNVATAAANSLNMHHLAMTNNTSGSSTSSTHHPHPLQQPHPHGHGHPSAAAPTAPPPPVHGALGPHHGHQHHHHPQQQQQSHQEMNDTQPSIVIPPLLGVCPLGTTPLTKEQLYQLQLLENAYYRMPVPMDTERYRYHPLLNRTPYITPSYYPQQPLQNGDSPEYFQRLSTDTLFFIFYYLEGTKAQYLAAKALKKQSWRFHTKYMMWFQRHEEPKVINEEYEQGTYIYFDYEKWGQKKKEGFIFEYKYLEDRDLN